MTNWDSIMTARARHSTFCGKTAADETAYYAFFEGDDQHPLALHAWRVALVKALRFAVRRGKLILPVGGLTVYPTRQP